MAKTLVTRLPWTVALAAGAPKVIQAAVLVPTPRQGRGPF